MTARAILCFYYDHMDYRDFLSGLSAERKKGEQGELTTPCGVSLPFPAPGKPPQESCTADVEALQKLGASGCIFNILPNN